MTATIEALREAVQGLHGCSATFERFEHVTERRDGEVAWEGDIYVFALEGHPTASHCYAWSEPVSGSERRRFFALLHEAPVVSAILALRASIIHDVGDDPSTDPSEG